MTDILDPQAGTGDDPKPPFPSDPSGEPPIEEPGGTPPEREEPDGGDDGSPAGDAPMIAR